MFGINLQRTTSDLLRVAKENQLANQVIINLLQEMEYGIRSQTVVETLRQRIAAYETGINLLKSGYLPNNLIAYDQLREVLYDIEKVLPAEYHLGIPMDDIQQYYQIPLCKFENTPEGLVINLVIPLSVGPPVKTEMYATIHHSFPLPEKWVTDSEVQAGTLVNLVPFSRSVGLREWKVQGDRRPQPPSL